jgi:hypothetical protein
MNMHACIQTAAFLADCNNAGLSEDEVAAMVAAISANPLLGDIIPGTGGARKCRFAGRGKGKSGGYRTVSYYAGEDVPVLMLALINKGERADISAAERNELRKYLATYAEEYRNSVRNRVQQLKPRSRKSP